MTLPPWRGQALPCAADLHVTPASWFLGARCRRHPMAHAKNGATLPSTYYPYSPTDDPLTSCFNLRRRSDLTPKTTVVGSPTGLSALLFFLFFFLLFYFLRLRGLSCICPSSRCLRLHASCLVRLVCCTCWAIELSTVFVSPPVVNTCSLCGLFILRCWSRFLVCCDFG